MEIRSLISAAAMLASMSVIIAGCSSAQSDWTKAASENTVPAYQSFVAAHPNDKHAFDAQAMILKIQDENGWQEAQHAGTNAAYENYLQRFAEGAHVAAAKEAMTAFDRSAAWKALQVDISATGIQSFLQKYPTGAEADQARAKLKELTGYRVHVASESTKSKAERKLAKLKSRLPESASDLTITPDSEGKTYSIDSPAMSEAEATSDCGTIKQRKESCEVVAQ
jgi:hypothetical protein